MKLYKYSTTDFYFQGIADFPDNYVGVPLGYTKIPVPSLNEGEFARWYSTGWEIVGEKITPIVKTIENTPRKITVYSFRSRFTSDEKVSIYTLAKTNILVQIWLDDLSTAQEVDLDFPATKSAIQEFVTLGVLTQDRANEILG